MFYRNSRALLRDMSPTGTRTGVLQMPYEYRWPSGAGMVDWIITSTRSYGVIVERVSPETGIFRRKGVLKLVGTESALYQVIFEISKEIAEEWP